MALGHTENWKSLTNAKSRSTKVHFTLDPFHIVDWGTFWGRKCDFHGFPWHLDACTNNLRMARIISLSNLAIGLSKQCAAVITYLEATRVAPQKPTSHSGLISVLFHNLESQGYFLAWNYTLYTNIIIEIGKTLSIVVPPNIRGVLVPWNLASRPHLHPEAICLVGEAIHKN